MFVRVTQTFEALQPVNVFQIWMEQATMRPIGLSIVVTAYGELSHIKSSYLSIASCHLDFPIEIVVVDDCNHFILETELAPWANSNAIFIRNSSNKGAQYSRRIGLDAARFSNVMLIDGDDFLSPESHTATFLTQAHHSLNKDKDLALVYGPTMMTGDATGLTSSAYPATLKDVVEKHHIPIFMLHRRDDALPDEMYPNKILKWQDWHAAIVLLASRWRKGLESRISYIDLPAYTYRVRDIPNRVSQVNISEEQMTRATISDHHDFFETHVGLTDLDQITNRVLKCKPSLLECLLRIANHDIATAREFIQQREITIKQKLSRKLAP